MFTYNQCYHEYVPFSVRFLCKSGKNFALKVRAFLNYSKLIDSKIAVSSIILPKPNYGQV